MERNIIEEREPTIALEPELEAFDALEGCEAEIEAGYRRRLAGLGRMRPFERIAARQAARAWKAAARRALAERRASFREARRVQRRWRAGTINVLKQGEHRWP